MKTVVTKDYIWYDTNYAKCPKWANSYRDRKCNYGCLGLRGLQGWKLMATGYGISLGAE